MELLDPTFAGEFNVSREDAFSVFDVRRAAVSLPLQANRLKMFVEAGLVTFSSCGRSLKKRSARQPCAPSKSLSSHLHGLSKVAVVGFCA